MNIPVPVFPVSSYFSWFLDEDLNNISLHLACFDFVRKQLVYCKSKVKGRGVSQLFEHHFMPLQQTSKPDSLKPEEYLSAAFGVPHFVPDGNCKAFCNFLAMLLKGQDLRTAECSLMRVSTFSDETSIHTGRMCCL